MAINRSTIKGDVPVRNSWVVTKLLCAYESLLRGLFNMCIPEPPSQIFFMNIFFPRDHQTSQVILMEDLGNYCVRESIFVDLIFIYKFLEPSFVPATQG